MLACLIGAGAGVILGVDAAGIARAPELAALAGDDPVVLEGVLRDDAVPSDFGVTCTLDVRRVRRAGSPGADARRRAPDDRRHRHAGGAARVAGGAPGARHGHAAAPAPYRNFGTPDQELRLAWRGTRVFGAVKSASLVEVLARGSPLAEATAAARAWARRTVAAAIGPDDPQGAAIVARGPHRRSRRPVAGHRSAHAAGRHLPRAGDLGRQHRRARRDRPRHRRPPRPGAAAARGRRARRARAVCRGRRRRRLGRPRDAGRGGLPVGARTRPAHAGDQRRRRHGRADRRGVAAGRRRRRLLADGPRRRLRSCRTPSRARSWLVARLPAGPAAAGGLARRGRRAARRRDDRGRGRGRARDRLRLRPGDAGRPRAQLRGGPADDARAGRGDRAAGAPPRSIPCWRSFRRRSRDGPRPASSAAPASSMPCRGPRGRWRRRRCGSPPPSSARGGRCGRLDAAGGCGC